MYKEIESSMPFLEDSGSDKGDPAWRSGAITLQGHSTQDFTEPCPSIGKLVKHDFPQSWSESEILRFLIRLLHFKGLVAFRKLTLWKFFFGRTAYSLSEAKIVWFIYYSAYSLFFLCIRVS